VTSSTSAVFGFSSSEAGSTFACKLDGVAVSCSSPVSFSGLSDGSHTFQVTATDQAGNTDPTPASQTWTVDTKAPVTSIDSAPPAFSNVRNPSFSFHANESGATFSCTLDGVAAPCNSPKAYSALKDGAHTFQVAATDAAGNVEGSPPRVSWTVDTVAPNTSITAAPPATTTSTTASFRIWTDESGATYSCTLDGVTAPCVWNPTFTGLSVGAHRIKVAAIDRAGNADATPAIFNWTIVPSLTGASTTAPPSTNLVPGPGPGTTPHLRLTNAGTLVLRLGPQPLPISGAVHLTLALKPGGKNAAAAHFRTIPHRATSISLRLRASLLKRMARRVRAVAILTAVYSGGERLRVGYSFILFR
jgi:hypothetical protein